MIPHFVGWFPYVACWVVYFTTFFSALEDLRRRDEDLWERVPDFVPYAIIGTGIWFTSFTFVQWRYQYVSPDFVSALSRTLYALPLLTPSSRSQYWKTEWIYSFLSLGAKMFLGLLLYINVLAFSSFSEGVSDSN